MGVEPMNTGFADQRVSHFATGAHWYNYNYDKSKTHPAWLRRVGSELVSKVASNNPLKHTPACYDSNSSSCVES